MIFRKPDKKEDKDTSQTKESAQSAKDVPITGKAIQTQAHPESARAIKRPDQGSTDSDPIAADLIRRVLAAIDGWKRDNNLSALPPRIAFEQALSILNALDRNSPHQE
jgi:hypothetical protein